MAEYIKRMGTFSDEMCEGIDCGVCPFYNKAGENDCQVVAFLRSIPAADARPVVRGRWEKGTSENGVTTALFCSCCHYENRHWYEWSYCPNCGAMMEES